MTINQLGTKIDKHMGSSSIEPTRGLLATIINGIVRMSVSRDISIDYYKLNIEDRIARGVKKVLKQHNIELNDAEAQSMQINVIQLFFSISQGLEGDMNDIRDILSSKVADNSIYEDLKEVADESYGLILKLSAGNNFYN